MNDDELNRMVLILGHLGTPELKREVLGMAVHSIVSVVRKRESLGETEKTIAKEIKAEISLDSAVLSRIYHLYGRNFTSSSALKYIQSIKGWIPDLAGLSITLIPATGITTYMAIVRAMQQFTDFPWVNFGRAFLKEDFKNFLDAHKVIRGDVYYRYNGNMESVKTAGYGDLAWVAEELLVRAGGETLQSVKTPKPMLFYDFFERAISDYVSSRSVMK